MPIDKEEILKTDYYEEFHAHAFKTQVKCMILRKL